MTIENFAAKHNLIYGICSFPPKSIIVVGKGYPPSPFTNLSSLAFGRDYHHTLTEILKDLSKTINASSTIMVDTGPLYERPLAVKAGLGFMGKNGLVISPVLGSFFNIGLLVVDTYLEPTEPSTQSCPEDCNLCEKACPTNLSLCISSLTQKKGNLTDREKELIGNQLYGCDLCQLCCPFNNITPPTEQEDPKTILNMTEPEFDSRFGHTAMAWRGFKHLRRNAKIVLQNMYPDGKKRG